MSAEESPRVGFIGLGNMGRPLATRLLESGHRLVAFDIDAGAVTGLQNASVAAADSPKAVADACELVLLSLPAPSAVRTVALDEHGVHEGSRIRWLVDLSTTGAPTSREVARGLTEAGIAMVDAPVSGGVAGATKGTLAVMAAGSPEAVQAVEPILAVFGRLFVVGTEPGQGQVMKLLNNYLSATAIAATSEALVFGAKAGLEPQMMLDAINAGSGRNTATEDKFPRSVLPGTFDAGFTNGLMYKDLALFAAQADELGIPLWIGSAVRQYWQHVRDEMGPDADFTTAVQPLERWARVSVRSRKETS